jgi:hypothetical protein
MVIITSSDSGTGIVQQPFRRRKNLLRRRVWFCATKIVQNNRQLTVTTAHLQHRDCRYSVS